ncbi:aconitase iron-sulfur domain-containing protein [Thozetella sp. PMI_491]|nr:aconitase iron-sulfur domain-containing protein [Thozetella sp. PMI_491]
MASTTAQVLGLVETTRGVKLAEAAGNESHPIMAIEAVSAALKANGNEREADALQQVVTIAITSPDYGGKGLSKEGGEISEEDKNELLFLVSAWLEALNSQDRARPVLVPVTSRPAGRRPMNVTEKIFAMHDVASKGYVQPGEMIRVAVDWIMSSELSWHGMIGVYNKLGNPGIFRNDRFWLAGDHVVEPRTIDTPVVKNLLKQTDYAKNTFKMTEYQGNNYTIMHTEFFRERTQPGQLIIGSDSHTCSSGANGCLSIGLGAADVTMALVTGETWFKVPDVVEIRMVGKPPRGVGGKDVILYILKELKRNTVAADRVVEYTGPGLEHLGPDARFAIANMTTEFGGITGIVVPDHITAAFINKRKTSRHKSNSYYFKADEGCSYAESHTIDLSKCEPFIARYPAPDDVVPVSEMDEKALDGCFIGACTTAEEDIIMGALILEAGFRMGKTPVSKGKRKVTPGSRPIVDMLKKTGLYEVYEKAGFEIGVPGCSYCVGMSADVAAPGEVWLSSQNRNFKNRMGEGSIGNLASAATVAASSFDMKMVSPQPFIDMISEEQWDKFKGKGSIFSGPVVEPKWVEPAEPASVEDAGATADAAPEAESSEEAAPEAIETSIKSTIFRLGDFIDTDALAPAQFLASCNTEEQFGKHCLEFTHPHFRQRVQDGSKVVVAGQAFGCGSSRMEAVQALLGIGIKCVIAKSFAFIYSRNQPSLGLIGIQIKDEAFYEAAQDGVDIEIDLIRNVATVGGKEFPFGLSQMEKSLTYIGGVAPAFQKYGKKIFDVLTSGGKGVKKGIKTHGQSGPMAW